MIKKFDLENAGDNADFDRDLEINIDNNFEEHANSTNEAINQQTDGSQSPTKVNSHGKSQEPSYSPKKKSKN